MQSLSFPTRDEQIRKICGFLQEIGIEVKFESVPGTTFLAGITIRNGQLVVDDEKLLYPGDILHEAGHIAVVEEQYRAGLNDNVTMSPEHLDGNELVAILWSYAALKAIGLPEEVVFHPDGYKGDSEWYIEQFHEGRYVGLPLLQWMGMTADKKKAAELGIAPFPETICWLRKDRITSAP
jgi:hypothetical protein